MLLGFLTLCVCRASGIPRPDLDPCPQFRPGCGYRVQWRSTPSLPWLQKKRGFWSEQFWKYAPSVRWTEGHLRKEALGPHSERGQTARACVSSNTVAERADPLATPGFRHTKRVGLPKLEQHWDKPFR